MNRILQAIGATLKAFTMRWGTTRWGWSGMALGGTQYNYGQTLFTARGNAIVMACVRWVCRTFPEAPLIVQTRAADGALQEQPDHPLAALLERPNPFYSGLQLWTGTLADWLLTGNAYWVKVRSAQGRPVQLWWVPANMVEPKWDDGTAFIDRYEYAVEGQVYKIAVADIVHFRDGFDPNNIRKGLSPLASAVREIATDDEAANFTASILRNMGVPGVVIAPEETQAVSTEALEEIKTQFTQRFGGDNRGQPLVMRGPSKVTVLSFSPEQLQMREARRIPEERVTAIFGTPAVVVGLGAGLDRSTYSNMAEAREAAYESMIIPMQRLLLADLQQQLVPDFGDPTRLRVAHDYSAVRVLQEDQDALHTRAREDLKAGLLTLNQALGLIGEDAVAQGEVYYLPATHVVTAADALVPPEPAPAEDTAATDEAVPMLEAAGLRPADDPVVGPLLAARATNGDGQH